MRITIICLLCVSVTSAINIKAQSSTVNISVNNMQIKNIIAQIEEQTEYLFVYNQSIDLSKTVTMNVFNVSVADALKTLLEGTDIIYAVEGHNILLLKKGEEVPKLFNGHSKSDFPNNSLSSVSADKKQQNTEKIITGTVKDQQNEPVVGAAVMEKGTTNGTITDYNGNFSISVTPNATLNVSFIGFVTQDVKIEDNTTINVILKDDLLKLDEVIVVGYGTARKSDVTGSVVRADLTALQESPNVNLLNALQGLVPGLNVSSATEAGKDPDFSIRGRTSISGTTTPLIVLDGIIYRGSLMDINMNDVASIDVLKDASAAAIYGSQASNGVLLITTKTGTVKSKPIISYSGYFSYQQPTNKDLIPENRDGFLRKIADRFLSESRIGDDMLQMNPDWDSSKYMMDRNALEGYNNGVDTDWWNLLTNDNPYIQSHNMNIRGKSDLSSYFFSVGYLDQENLIINDKFKRYNIRINLDMKVTDWLKVGTQSSFTMSNTSGTSPTISTVMGLPPVVAPRDEDGVLIKQPYKTVNNPLLEIDQHDLYKRYHLSANFYADITFPFLKGLSYRANISQYLRNIKDYNFNELAQNFQGAGYKENISQYGWTFDNILTYKKTLKKHDFDVTLLYGAEKREQESTRAGASIFANDILGYNKLNAGQSDMQTANSGAWEEASLYSMGRIRYTFNDRYTFTGTIRRDGFSGFGKNNKFGIFPSAAVAWRISEEEFMNKVSWVDNLKLRLSYGTNGNRTVGRYQTLSQLTTANGYVYGDGGTSELRQYISTLANANLKWETTNTFNIALDFSVFNSRLFGSMEYYLSDTKNLLYNINIPRINGFASIPSNIGKMGNKGFELSMTGIPVKTKDFNWSVTFNYSINRNKVKSILGIDADGDGKEDDLIANKIFIGKPYGVAYDYNIIGMWQLEDYRNGKIPDGFTYGTYKIEDIDNSGTYTADKDRKIIGYTDPSYRFSIQNTFRYKNWDLKIFINSIQGGKKHYYGQPGNGLDNPDNIYQKNIFNFDYWTPENPNARYRQLGYYTQAIGYGFSPYVQRNFIRLQDITLAYTVPQSFLKKFNISKMSLFITGKNLITITDWDGWDPETGRGLDVTSSPLMKSYTFGLNFEF